MLRLRGSVGEGGANSRTDVWNLQALLIKVRTAQGQPTIKLDGRIGPETIEAIKTFQRQQFGWADGLVEAGRNTLKHLNLLTNGQTRQLMQPVTTKRQGRWEVKIGLDGEIIVRPGDWLSKYSAAVDGDFYTIWPYMRLTDEGQFIKISNPSLIHAGESLYHIPTVLALHKKYGMPPVNVPPVKEMSDEEKAKLTEDFLTTEFGLRGDNAKALAYGLNGLRVGSAALTALEVAGVIAQGTLLAGLVTAASLAAAIGGIPASIISLANALETGQKLAGMRAIAYATVAWSFGDDKGNPAYPGFSQRLERNMRGGGVTEGEINRCKRAWADAVAETKKQLEKKALGDFGYAKSLNTQKVLVDAAKKRLMLAGRDSRKELCKFVMQSFDAQVSGQVLVIWQNERNNYLYNE